jgi:hypothetical protein
VNIRARTQSISQGAVNAQRRTRMVRQRPPGNEGIVSGSFRLSATLKEKGLDVDLAESAVAARPYTIGWQERRICPVAHCVRVDVEQLGCLGRRQELGMILVFLTLSCHFLTAHQGN